MPKSDYSQCLDFVLRTASDLFTSKAEAEKFVKEFVGKVESYKLHSQNDSSKALSRNEAFTKAMKATLTAKRVAATRQRITAYQNLRHRRNIMAFASHPDFTFMGAEGHGGKAGGLDTFFNGSKVELAGVLGSKESVDLNIRLLFKEFIGQLEQGMVDIRSKHGRAVFKIFQKGEYDQDIYRELYTMQPGKPHTSVTGNQIAFDIAEVVQKIQVDMVQRANLAGARINWRADFIVSQTHHPRRIEKMGYEAWRDLMVGEGWRGGLLDLDSTFEGVSPGNREAVLRDAFDGIVTGAHGRLDPKLGYQGRSSMANRLGAERFFIFKDADAAFAYTYGEEGIRPGLGRGNVKDSLIHSMGKMARDIGIMQKMGPDAQRNLDMVIKSLIQRVKDNKALSATQKKAQIDSLNSKQLQSSWRALNGELDQVAPGHEWWAIANKGARAWALLSYLENITISAFADKASFYATLRNYDLGRVDALVSTIVKPHLLKGEALKRSMHLSGVGLDGYAGSVVSRYNAVDDVRGELFKAQQILFKLSGMNLWNDVHKTTFGMIVSADMAYDRAKVFGQLSETQQRTLRQYGITEGEWDILRTHAVELGGRNGDTPFMVPHRVAEIDLKHFGDVNKEGINNLTRKRNLLKDKYRGLLVDMADDAVPTAGNREKRMTSWGTQAGSGSGELVRNLTQFMSFPFTVGNKIIKREVYGYGSKSFMDWTLNDTSGKVKMAEFIAFSFVAGLASLSVSDMKKGRKPRKLMNDDGTPNYEVFIQAFDRAGAAGVYGNFLFNEYDRSWRSLARTAVGPVYGQVDAAVGIAGEKLGGADVSKPTMKFALRNTPFLDLYFVRPTVNYMFLWSLQEMVNPGGLLEEERKQMRENDVEYIPFLRPTNNRRFPERPGPE